MMEKRGCLQCRHYYQTWDPKAPRGCKAYRFKTTKEPCEVVKKESMQECSLFDLKDRLKKAPSLDDEEFWS